MSCETTTVEFIGRILKEDTNEYNDKVDSHKLWQTMQKLKNIQSLHLVLEPGENCTICFVTFAKSQVTDKVSTVIYGRGGGKVFNKIVTENLSDELSEFFKFMIGEFADEFNEVFEFLGAEKTNPPIPLI